MNDENIIQLTGPMKMMKIRDTITIETKCNDCKSDNIAVIVRRIPIEEETK